MDRAKFKPDCSLRWAAVRDAVGDATGEVVGEMVHDGNHYIHLEFSGYGSVGGVPVDELEAVAAAV